MLEVHPTAACGEALRFAVSVVGRGGTAGGALARCVRVEPSQGRVLVGKTLPLRVRFSFANSALSAAATVTNASTSSSSSSAPSSAPTSASSSLASSPRRSTLSSAATSTSVSALASPRRVSSHLELVAPLPPLLPPSQQQQQQPLVDDARVASVTLDGRSENELVIRVVDVDAEWCVCECVVQILDDVDETTTNGTDDDAADSIDVVDALRNNNDDADNDAVDDIDSQQRRRAQAPSAVAALVASPEPNATSDAHDHNSLVIVL